MQPSSARDVMSRIRERVDPAEVASIVAEASNALNGWKVILRELRADRETAVDRAARARSERESFGDRARLILVRVTDEIDEAR